MFRLALVLTGFATLGVGVGFEITDVQVAGVLLMFTGLVLDVVRVHGEFRDAPEHLRDEEWPWPRS